MTRALPWLLFGLVVSCDSDSAARVAANPALQCVVDICAVLSVRAPIIPNHRLKWGWDWRTAEACMATMTCGNRDGECRSAVAKVPQIGPGSEPECSDGAIYRVWHACRDISGAGGVAPDREKQ